MKRIKKIPVIDADLIKPSENILRAELKKMASVLRDAAKQISMKKPISIYCLLSLNHNIDLQMKHTIEEMFELQKDNDSYKYNQLLHKKYNESKLS